MDGMTTLTRAQVWDRVKEFARRAADEKRQISTLQNEALNIITDVKEGSIGRRSTSGRSNASRVTRSMVFKVWDALLASGRTRAPRGALYFTPALMLAALNDVLMSVGNGEIALRGYRRGVGSRRVGLTGPIANAPSVGVASTARDSAFQQRVGTAYRRAREDVRVADRDPFAVDPDKVDRGNRAHAKTQNALANFLEEHGIEPRSLSAGDPEFDLAWERDGATFVAEVKSITESNEEKQLRLGLGQVLRYRHMLEREGTHVVAVLVAEREPTDSTWMPMCERLSVRFVWPAIFDVLLQVA
jgi:hypothetical protein